MDIVFASSNLGKIKELQLLLAEFAIKVISQAELGVSDVAETGLTFVENALIKARHAAAQTGLPSIADDSGLLVDALGQAPGIYSARYAGAKATSEANIERLLTDMKDVPLANRQARFHCTLVYLSSANDPTPLIAEGRWQGLILQSTQGKQGFGYDPVFFDSNQQCTAAELTTSQKNLISHRGQALRALVAKLREYKQ